MMKRVLRWVCLTLVLSFLLAVPVSAQENTNARGSAYIASHTLQMIQTGRYEVQVWFDVIATAQRMDEIGVSEIIVYWSSNGSNWYEAYTYTMEDYPELITQNATHHSGHITVYHATGRYYQAYVTFYAKKDNGQGRIFRYSNVVQMS